MYNPPTVPAPAVLSLPLPPPQFLSCPALSPSSRGRPRRCCSHTGSSSCKGLHHRGCAGIVVQVVTAAQELLLQPCRGHRSRRHRGCAGVVGVVTGAQELSSSWLRGSPRQCRLGLSSRPSLSPAVVVSSTGSLQGLLCCRCGCRVVARVVVLLLLSCWIMNRVARGRRGWCDGGLQSLAAGERHGSLCACEGRGRVSVVAAAVLHRLMGRKKSKSKKKQTYLTPNMAMRCLRARLGGRCLRVSRGVGGCTATGCDAQYKSAPDGSLNSEMK